LFKGALAEAFIEAPPSRSVRGTSRPAATYEAIAAGYPAVDRDGLSEEDRAAIDAASIAYCFTPGNQAAVRDLLTTDPASPQEREKLRAMDAQLRACGSGRMPRIGQLTMRSLLAVALYHRLAGQ
jgi:hypothetical protein